MAERCAWGHEQAIACQQHGLGRADMLREELFLATPASGHTKPAADSFRQTHLGPFVEA